MSKYDILAYGVCRALLVEIKTVDIIWSEKKYLYLVACNHQKKTPLGLINSIVSPMEKIFLHNFIGLLLTWHFK